MNKEKLIEDLEDIIKKSRRSDDMRSCIKDILEKLKRGEY